MATFGQRYEDTVLDQNESNTAASLIPRTSVEAHSNVDRPYVLSFLFSSLLFEEIASYPAVLAQITQVTAGMLDLVVAFFWLDPPYVAFPNRITISAFSKIFAFNQRAFTGLV
jgi:hypothetical protein